MELFRKLKYRILSAFRSQRTKVDKQNKKSGPLIEKLARNDDLIVKQSDKCKGLVVMQKTDYVSKASDLLKDYLKVPTNPTPDLETKTKDLTNKILRGKVPDRTLDKLLPRWTRTAEFYGLPKTHKPNNPLRPIVSACGDPLDKLSWFLQQILTQLLHFVPTYLENTGHYLSKVKRIFPGPLPKGAIVFSLDVVNLYGSIPIQEAIAATIGLIKDNLGKINVYGLSLTDIETLLQHVLTNNFIRFGSNYHKQTEGIAMGNRLAPPIAIAFMHSLESRFVESCYLKPSILLRYIDDYFGIWVHGLKTLLEFYENINNLHPKIKFTLEHTYYSGSLPFLDTMFTVHPNGNYTTELFIKPMAAPIILNYESAHPKKTKLGILTSQTKRAIRVSSSPDATSRSLDKIKHLFLDNGYPEHIIDRTFRTSLRPTRLRQQNKTKKDKSLGQVTYMRLPYVNETVCRRVNGIVRGSKQHIRVAWLSGPTLKNKLVRSALESPPCRGKTRCHTCPNGLSGKCHLKNVVYKISCKICLSNKTPYCYIGETSRPVRERFKEHLSDARLRKLGTGLGEHILDKHTDLNNKVINVSFQIEVLSRNRDLADNKIDESIKIRDNNPNLNTFSKSWPII